MEFSLVRTGGAEKNHKIPPTWKESIPVEILAVHKAQTITSRPEILKLLI
jgi:hypothetical protein